MIQGDVIVGSIVGATKEVDHDQYIWLIRGTNYGLRYNQTSALYELLDNNQDVIWSLDINNGDMCVYKHIVIPSFEPPDDNGYVQPQFRGDAASLSGFGFSALNEFFIANNGVRVLRGNASGSVFFGDVQNVNATPTVDVSDSSSLPSYMYIVGKGIAGGLSYKVGQAGFIEKFRIVTNNSTPSIDDITNADIDGIIASSGSGDIDFPLETVANYSFPLGTSFEFWNGGTGTYTVTPEAGVTINGSAGAFTISATKTKFIHLANNTWLAG